jgi:hypothetical protein
LNKIELQLTYIEISILTIMFQSGYVLIMASLVVKRNLSALRELWERSLITREEVLQLYKEIQHKAQPDSCLIEFMAEFLGAIELSEHIIPASRKRSAVSADL